MHLCLTVEYIASGLHLSVFEIVSPPQQSGLQEGIHVNLWFPFVVQPRILISRDASSHRAFDYGQAKTGESVTPTQRLTPKCGSPWWR